MNTQMRDSEAVRSLLSERLQGHFTSLVPSGNAKIQGMHYLFESLRAGLGSIPSGVLAGRVTPFTWSICLMCGTLGSIPAPHTKIFLMLTNKIPAVHLCVQLYVEK